MARRGMIWHGETRWGEARLGVVGHGKDFILKGGNMLEIKEINILIEALDLWEEQNNNLTGIGCKLTDMKEKLISPAYHEAMQAARRIYFCVTSHRISSALNDALLTATQGK